MKLEQLYGCNFHYTRHPLDYFIDCMKKHNIHFIEFYAATPHFHVDDYTVDEAKEIKKKFDALILKLKLLQQNNVYIQFLWFHLIQSPEKEHLNIMKRL